MSVLFGTNIILLDLQQQVQGSRRRKAAKPQRADADPDVIKGGGESDDDEGKDGARGPSLLKFAVEFDLKRERPGKYKRALARLGPEAASLMVRWVVVFCFRRRFLRVEICTI